METERKKRWRKRMKTVIGTSLAVMLLMSGCGQETGTSYDGASDGAGSEVYAETEQKAPVNDDAVPDAESAPENEPEEDKAEAGAPEENQIKADEQEADKQEADKLTGDTLTCDVVSVNAENQSVAATKIYVENNPDGSQTALSYVGGGDGQENIMIYFRDDARYTLKIIKNGGTDVTTKEADFSDIQEGDILSLKGKAAVSEKSGFEFLASEAVISRVIL